MRRALIGVGALAALAICARVTFAQSGPATSREAASTQPALPTIETLTVDLTSKGARLIQGQVDGRMPLGSDSPVRWRDKPVPGIAPPVAADPANTVLKIDVVFPPPDGRLPGLVVFVSPGEKAMLPVQYLAALRERNLIVASARGTGNNRHLNWRLFGALAAVRAVEARGQMDLGRVYVAGLSGGGKMSALAGEIQPETFAGAMPICGPAHWRDIPAGDGTTYPGYSPLSVASLIALAKPHPFVFLTGTRDYNLEPTQIIEAAMKKEGFTATSVTVCADLGHALPDAEDFEAALATLDTPANRRAGEIFREASVKEKQNKPGEALRLFHAAWSRDAKAAPTAEAGYKRLAQQRDKDEATIGTLQGAARIAAEKKFALRWEASPQTLRYREALLMP